MRIRTNQAGFSVVELLIILIFVGVLGFVGYTVYHRQHTKTADTAGSSQADNNQPTTNNVASAPSISSTSDLDKAAATLDQTDPSGSNNADASQLDSQTTNL